MIKITKLDRKHLSLALTNAADRHTPAPSTQVNLLMAFMR
jgi:hypothetical protein